MSGPSIRRAGLTVVLFTIAGKVLGLVREMVVAATYGTSHVVDVYLAGITIPGVIGTILSQALPNAFVPIFSGNEDSTRRGKHYAWVLVAAVGFGSAALWFAAAPVASLTSSGFAPSLRMETVAILRIAAVYMALVTVEGLLRSRLLAHKRFVRSGAAGLWPSVAMIIAIILFPDGGSRTLVWGFVTGSLAATVWNLMPYFRTRNRASQESESASSPPAAQGEGRWVGIVILLGSVGLLYTLLDRHLASHLTEGSIAALQYASLVASPPLAIWGMAIGAVVLPYLSQTFHECDRVVAGQIIDRAFRWALLGSIPAAVWLGVFGNDIVSIVLERGAFDAASRVLTGSLLVPYAFWLVPAVLGAILGKIFYAMFRWRPILLAISLGLCAKLILSFWWIQDLGAAGLAGATAAGAGVACLVLLVALPPDLGRTHWSGWARLTATLIIFSFAGAIVGHYAPLAVPVAALRAVSLVRIAAGSVVTVLLVLMLGPRVGISEATRVRDWMAQRLLPHR